MLLQKNKFGFAICLGLLIVFALLVSGSNAKKVKEDASEDVTLSKTSEARTNDQETCEQSKKDKKLKEVSVPLMNRIAFVMQELAKTFKVKINRLFDALKLVVELLGLKVSPSWWIAFMEYVIEYAAVA